MGNNSKRIALGILIAAGGCVAGAYSAYAAYSNGSLITDGLAGTMFGLAFAAVVIVSWIMLPWADKRAEGGSYRDAWLWRMSWLMALGFVLANSIIYTVHYRTEMVETKGMKIEAFERAQRLQALAAAELTGLRTNPRWGATSGCSNATAARSIQYCDHVREVEARVQSGEAILQQGRPASKDAGAETLAWVLGVDESKIRRSLPIFWAVILELIASLCMREAFATWRPVEQSEAGANMARVAHETNAGRAMAGQNPLAALPAMRVVAPYNGEPIVVPRRAAMNDNMPLAAYA
jgi:hypothetical protein